MILAVSFYGIAQSQSTTISGNIKDKSSGEGLSGVNIVVKGKVIGTITDSKGDFTLSVKSTPPLTIEISFIGFTSQLVNVTETNTSELEITLLEEFILGQEIVISASREEENIMKSPVSIEKMDLLDIQNSTAPTFYDAIANLKGVDMSAQSIGFKAVNTRGFQSNGNVRLVQIIDGVDNQAQGLNYPLGNTVGISELDLESVELLPGPASALYGPNALNGTLVLKSKSPFEYQGLSVMSKIGINHIDGRDDNLSPYQDHQLRYAKSFNNKFAIKIVGSILRASDFVAVDYRDGNNILGNVTRENSIAYDGVNSYGEIAVNLGEVAAIANALDPVGFPAFLVPLMPNDASGTFTTTGYKEIDMIDNNATNYKLSTALHYRISDEMELIGQWTYGTGKSALTATDRFILDGFRIWTGRFELKGDNFFIKAYTTQENSGDSYGANTLGSLINFYDGYIDNYFGAFLGARLGAADIPTAHGVARNYADSQQSKPGSQKFQHLFDSLRAIPIPNGAKFLDKSNFWHYEGMYNLSKLVDFADIIVGGSLRNINLDSEGTLFALDAQGNEFEYFEYSFYNQITKNVLDDKLRLSASLRYDKNEFFKGQFSPRFSSVYTIDSKHNIRLSFQKGFRIPTTNNQFAEIDITTSKVIGSNPYLVDKYHFKSNTVYYSESVEAARIVNDVNLLEAVPINDFETEKISSFEIGYKSVLWDKLLIDGYYYFSSYQDFIANVILKQFVPSGTSPDPGPTDALALVNDVTNANTQEYIVSINADGNIRSQGAALGLEYSLPKGFIIKGNVAYNVLTDQQDLIDQGFSSQYNTAKVRYNLCLDNRNLVDKLSFGINYRWQDSFFWESELGNATIPAFGTLDMQLSYELHGLHSILKLGGSNILNKRYTTSFASPSFGAIYYLSLTFNDIFK